MLAKAVLNRHPSLAACRLVARKVCVLIFFKKKEKGKKKVRSLALGLMLEAASGAAPVVSASPFANLKFGSAGCTERSFVFVFLSFCLFNSFHEQQSDRRGDFVGSGNAVRRFQAW